MTITDDEARQWRTEHWEGVPVYALRHLGMICRGCGVSWPCPTIRLLDERERLREVVKHSGWDSVDTALAAYAEWQQERVARVTKKEATR